MEPAPACAPGRKSGPPALLRPDFPVPPLPFPTPPTTTTTTPTPSLPSRQGAANLRRTITPPCRPASTSARCGKRERAARRVPSRTTRCQRAAAEPAKRRPLHIRKPQPQPPRPPPESRRLLLLLRCGAQQTTVPAAGSVRGALSSAVPARHWRATAAACAVGYKCFAQCFVRVYLHQWLQVVRGRTIVRLRVQWCGLIVAHRALPTSTLCPVHSVLMQDASQSAGV